MVNREELVETAGIRIFSCIRTEFEHEQWQSEIGSGFWIGIVLSGRVETSDPCNGKQIWGVDTKHVFWSNAGLVMHHKILTTAEAFAAIFIHLSPSSANGLFNQDDLEGFKHYLKSPVLLKSTSTERTLAWRILGTKAQGLERKLYVTSRAIDLVSQVLTPSAKRVQKSPKVISTAKLSALELERIFALSTQLVMEPNDQPPVDILALQLGMNMRKINAGFRALFGCTMYGFIIQSRLEKARTLLEAGEHNVAQAADFVGYDPAHFSTVFRKRFGLPPSSYCKSNN